MSQINISLKRGTSAKTGNDYNYISISTDDNMEITRLFLKDTEKAFFDSLLGSYEKIED